MDETPDVPRPDVEAPDTQPEAAATPPCPNGGLPTRWIVGAGLVAGAVALAIGAAALATGSGDGLGAMPVAGHGPGAGWCEVMRDHMPDHMHGPMGPGARQRPMTWPGDRDARRDGCEQAMEGGPPAADDVEHWCDEMAGAMPHRMRATR
ncbi:MAG: hypothetical protein ACRD0R_07590 [Acidimicrobiales bacterium]